MDISSRLKEERTRIGLKQHELAEIGGVGLSTQKNYESEKSDNVPDARYLSRVADSVDVTYILTGIGKERGTAPSHQSSDLKRTSVLGVQSQVFSGIREKDQQYALAAIDAKADVLHADSAYEAHKVLQKFEKRYELFGPRRYESYKYVFMCLVLQKTSGHITDFDQFFRIWATPITQSQKQK